MPRSFVDIDAISRAQGCLLGQLAGDSLGSLVEFRTPEDIRREYPGGVRELADGGTWNTIAGQPTDDSEMALALARMLVEKGRYDAEEARKAYVSWLDQALSIGVLLSLPVFAADPIQKARPTVP